MSAASMAPTPNAIALQKFVDVRLAAAKQMPLVEAVWFCRRWGEHVERQTQELSRLAARDAALPAHLVGLSAVDLVLASTALLSASVQYGKLVEQAAAA